MQSSNCGSTASLAMGLEIIEIANRAIRNPIMAVAVIIITISCRSVVCDTWRTQGESWRRVHGNSNLDGRADLHARLDIATKWEKQGRERIDVKVKGLGVEKIGS
jgi:hypothetical protein